MPEFYANLSHPSSDPAAESEFKPYPANLPKENYSEETIKPNKFIIYQLLPRLFGNKNTCNKFYGTCAENGVGKFADITEKALSEIKNLGATHIWYTGLMEHATTTDYSAQGIPPDDPVLVKGLAGSPYAIKDYYDVNPDFAVNVDNRLGEWQELLKRTQAAGLKVIIDFVPNHVARSYRSDVQIPGAVDFGMTDNTTVSFSPQNNFYYLPGEPLVLPSRSDLPAEALATAQTVFTEYPAKVSGNDVFSAAPTVNDWFETIKLNYGIDLQNHHHRHFHPVPDTWEKMLHILQFWTRQGVDGFRCDMAEMVPVEFWVWVIPQIKELQPEIIFIAEIYQPHHYHSYIHQGKFDFLYDKVGLYDSLRRLMCGGGHTGEITHVWAHDSRGISTNMLRFLENHDEQRIASPYFAGNPWTAIPAMTVAATLSTGPVLIYSGQEVGEPAAGSAGFQKEDGRTTIFDYWGVPEHQKWMNNGLFDGGGLTAEQRQLREFYVKLLNLLQTEEALQKGFFYLLNHQAEPGATDKIYSFLRFTQRQKLLLAVNFDLVHKHNINLELSAAESNLLFKANEKYVLTDILSTSPSINPEINFNPETASINLELHPGSAYIFDFKRATIS